MTKSKAFLIATTPKQMKKMLLHQVTYAREILTPTLVAQQRWTRKEISKKNCLLLIAKNINITYSQSDVSDAFKNLLGPKNVVCTYFPRGSIERNLHDGICNLEVLNPAVYKKYM
jgi:hypothetical protein